MVLHDRQSHARDVQLRIGADGRILFASDGACALFDRSEADLLARSIRGLVIPACRPALADALEVAREGRVVRLVVRVRPRRRSVRSRLLSLRQCADGTLSGVFFERDAGSRHRVVQVAQVRGDVALSRLARITDEELPRSLEVVAGWLAYVKESPRLSPDHVDRAVAAVRRQLGRQARWIREADALVDAALGGEPGLRVLPGGAISAAPPSEPPSAEHTIVAADLLVAAPRARASSV